MSLDGSEKTTTHGSQTSCEAYMTSVLVRECLYYHVNDYDKNPMSFDILYFHKRGKYIWIYLKKIGGYVLFFCFFKEVKFSSYFLESPFSLWFTFLDEEADQNEATSQSKSMPPNVSLTFKQTLKYVKVSGEKKLFHPTTDIRYLWRPYLYYLKKNVCLFVYSNIKITLPILMKRSPINNLILWNSYKLYFIMLNNVGVNDDEVILVNSAKKVRLHAFLSYLI